MAPWIDIFAQLVLQTYLHELVLRILEIHYIYIIHTHLQQPRSRVDTRKFESAVVSGSPYSIDVLRFFQNRFNTTKRQENVSPASSRFFCLRVDALHLKHVCHPIR